MIVDNCKAHPDVPGLKNINLVFLPSNMTYVMQPMDQGVIRPLKAFYRGKIVKKIIDSLEGSNCIPNGDICLE